MIKDIQGLLDYVYREIRGFTDVAVVGMSGGADSSLVATLCTQALGPQNVWSLHMPYGQRDWEKFNARSWALAEKLGIHKSELFINEVADAIVHQLGRLTNRGVNGVSKLTAGNSRSRARMCLLYGAAATIAENNSGLRVRVMGTGNLSEDFIGYDTKGGDALADLFSIGELFKSEVYQLLEWFRDIGVLDEEHIDRVPSAGLWEGQTDEEELGYTYNDMQPVIESFLKGESKGVSGLAYAQEEYSINSDLRRFVLDRHEANKHKHEAPRVLSLRQFCG